MKLKPFVQYEAVILHECYLGMERRHWPRAFAIFVCSRTLRAIAADRGETIDETFRSVEGIRGRMDGMEATVKGDIRNRKSTKLFREVVALYRDNIDRYCEILWDYDFDSDSVDRQYREHASDSDYEAWFRLDSRRGRSYWGHNSGWTPNPRRSRDDF